MCMSLMRLLMYLHVVLYDAWYGWFGSSRPQYFLPNDSVSLFDIRQSGSGLMVA